MIMRKFIPAITFLIISLYQVHGQRVKISGDTELYPEEIKEFMSNVSGEQEWVVDAFLQAWEKDSLFTAQEQEGIVEMSMLMEKNKCRPYPHFVNYFKCMMAFKKSTKDYKNYLEWEKGVQKILKKKKASTVIIKEVNTIFEFTGGLLEENILYESRSTKWVADDDNYTIKYNKELIVEFGEITLTCYAKRDSIQIYKTSGTVYPLEKKWKSKSSLVTWERGGYNRNDVFAVVPDYEIDLTHSEYEVEDVLFTNKFYFDQPLKGVLYDKVKFNKDQESATYPRFNSYTKKFEIKEIYENIDYSGGLSMQGAKLVGEGSKENPAKLYMYRNDTLILVAGSNYFGFKADRVSGQKTSVTIKLRNDSIYHPDLMFTYRVTQKELVLIKDDRYSSRGPYFNSYHNVDMNFDQLLWRLDEDEMKLTAPRGAAIGKAYFESVNYFNYNKFINMQGMDRVHPLISLRSFTRKYGSEDFPVDAFADYLNMPLHEVKHMAMRMAFEGFVFYDQNTEIITIKPRLHDYLAASVNKIDYDVIGFPSQVEAPVENAVFNLKNYDLTVNGIPRIAVSDSQNVVFYPKNNRIVLKENRDFQFDGVVIAGLLTFYGNNFFFKYDSFKVNLQNVDSLNLEFLTGQHDNYGLPVISVVKNRLEHVTGEIWIDKPDNKSGRKNYPDYPIFKSNESSYVYYSKKSIQNGVYEKDDFYFEVYPFVLDSLDNFNAAALVFEGEFSSAGIFPNFEQKLSLQPDRSLGFHQKTPPQGYPVYNGKGTYFADIWLSNKGLKGEGRLEYITSITESEDFNFFPDSMNTDSKTFEIKQKTTPTEYPQVNSRNNYIHWLPYIDEMYAYQSDIKFTMFNDTTSLMGDLLLTPSGLSGWGKMDLKNSDMKSDLFTYKAYDIFADTADFYLKSLHSDGYTVLTDNVNAHINYRDKKGWFKSNEEFTLVNFPENRYVSYIDYFMWDMVKKEMAMGTEGATQEKDTVENLDEEPYGPRYISVHPQQDSLNFVSPLAYYDYEHNFINATGVKFIEVADARIYPDEGNFTVEEDAKIQTLEKAMIIANKLTKYHTIHTATINITSKNYYSGLGNYDYVDENSDVQNIHFNEIKVDTGGHSIASGEIYEKQEFTLSPVYKFQGKAFLFADRKLLQFKGATQIEHNCEDLPASWLRFDTIIDPNEIYIPYPDVAKDINLAKIYNGAYLYYDSVHIYPAFLTSRKNYSDNPLVSAGGLLYYDKAQQLYKISSRDKLFDFGLPGNYVSLHRERCELYGEGKINLGADLGQCKLNTWGNLRHYIEDNVTELDMMMSMDFFIDEEMINLMAHEIDSLPGLNAADLNRRTYKKSMVEIIGKEKADLLQDELTLFGEIKELPPELKHTILFNQLKLVWDDRNNAYQSEGQIGIASINGVQINKMVDGLIVLQIKRSGDIMDMWLDLGKGDYYYFGYTRGVMHIHSSNRTFVETIFAMKPKERRMKVKRKETSYIYMIATDRKKNRFYGRYRRVKDGLDDEIEEGDEYLND